MTNGLIVARRVLPATKIGAGGEPNSAFLGPSDQRAARLVAVIAIVFRICLSLAAPEAANQHLIAHVLKAVALEIWNFDLVVREEPPEPDAPVGATCFEAHLIETGLKIVEAAAQQSGD